MQGEFHSPTLGILVFTLILFDRQVHGWLLLLTLEIASSFYIIVSNKLGILDFFDSAVQHNAFS